MNAFDRVMNTIKGLPVDRVPAVAVLGAYGGKLTQTDLRTLYSDAGAHVAGQRALVDSIGLDSVLATFDYTAFGEAFGGEVAWSDHQAPNMKRPAVRTVAAALELPLPDPHRTARLPMILAATRQLADTYAGTVPIFAAVPGPSALCALVLGLESWMETFLFDEHHATLLLQRTGELFVDWSNALFAAGADALIFTEVTAAPEFGPRSLFENRILPQLQALFGRLRGPVVFHHSGGTINPNLDLLRGLPGVVGVGISSKDDLAGARARLGPTPLLLGNLDNLSYPTLSPAEIRARSLACLRVAAPAGHYILANSAADIPLQTPIENLRAMIEACEAFAAGGAT